MMDRKERPSGSSFIGALLDLDDANGKARQLIPDTSVAERIEAANRFLSVLGATEINSNLQDTTEWTECREEEFLVGLRFERYVGIANDRGCPKTRVIFWNEY